MKKFLTLVFALVMALALAAPAMAFTSVQPDTDTPYELDIYLVDYDDDAFFGYASLPASDRGYAKNEIVAAIVEFITPKNEDLADDFDSLVLSGEDVTLNVTDNKISGKKATLYTSEGNLKFDWDGDELSYGTLSKFDPAGNDKKTTGKVLFFAKVTGDDASLTATLSADDSGFENPPAEGSYSSLHSILFVGDDYVVDHTTGAFVIYDEDLNPLFEITVDSKSKTKDLYIYAEEDGDYDAYLAVNPEAGVFYGKGSASRVTEKSLIRELQGIYEDAFVDDFGFDFSIQGGILKESYFTGINGEDDVSATVEIEPWTAYVTVPDAIVIDPPKTGDAASIVGFTMIVLAATAVVAVRKVRA